MYTRQREKYTSGQAGPVLLSFVLCFHLVPGGLVRLDHVGFFDQRGSDWGVAGKELAMSTRNSLPFSLQVLASLGRRGGGIAGCP